MHNVKNKIYFVLDNAFLFLEIWLMHNVTNKIYFVLDNAKNSILKEW